MVRLFFRCLCLSSPPPSQTTPATPDSRYAHGRIVQVWLRALFSRSLHSRSTGVTERKLANLVPLAAATRLSPFASCALTRPLCQLWSRNPACEVSGPAAQVTRRGGSRRPKRVRPRVSTSSPSPAAPARGHTHAHICTHTHTFVCTHTCAHTESLSEFLIYAEVPAAVHSAHSGAAGRLGYVDGPLGSRASCVAELCLRA